MSKELYTALIAARLGKSWHVAKPDVVAAVQFARTTVELVEQVEREVNPARYPSITADLEAQLQTQFEEIILRAVPARRTDCHLELKLLTAEQVCARCGHVASDHPHWAGRRP